MTEAENLWPAALEPLEKRPPVVILREQAPFVGKLTKGIVHARVTGGVQPLSHEDYDPHDDVPLKGHQGFLWQFEFVVPSLNNYLYDVFFIRHPVTLYPLTLGLEFQGSETLGEKYLSLKSEEAFKLALKRIFATKELHRVIHILREQGSGV